MWTALPLAWLAAQQVPEPAAPEPALERALVWLAAETADAEAWADVAPAAVNAAAKRQVVDALIAWLLLVCPEHPETIARSGTETTSAARRMCSMRAADRPGGSSRWLGSASETYPGPRAEDGPKNRMEPARGAPYAARPR